MTIIAVKDNIMAADSFTYRGTVGYPLPKERRKIRRNLKNDLLGFAGNHEEITKTIAWLGKEMHFERPPAGIHEAEDDALDVLWLRHGYGLWRFTKAFVPYPVPQPFAIGIWEAVVLCDGAMLAGATAAEAVALAIERVAYCGGEVQVETL
jgi:hypothetical protein